MQYIYQPIIQLPVELWVQLIGYGFLLNDYDIVLTVATKQNLEIYYIRKENYLWIITKTATIKLII